MVTSIPMGEGLTRLIGLLEDGYEPQDSEFGAFSDLNRTDAATIDGRWLQIPLATRALLLERAAELADEDLELHFEALGKIGLADPEAEVRERAVFTLWESEEREAAEKLAALVADDPGPGVRAAAALGLQHFVEALAMNRLHPSASDRISGALRAALEDPDVGVRAAAIQAAAALPEEWVADRILEAFESDERELRLAAVTAMGFSALDRWIEYLEDLLYSGELDLRQEAVLAAGNLGSELLIEPLAELLTEEDMDIVLAAVLALGEIGGEEATEKLQEFAPQAPEDLAEAIDAALEMASDTGLFRRFGELQRQQPDEDDDE